ncbi:MAG TPA: asparagine synthase (glutamine-hydrolyzing) [Puia sp.]|nr:asparagine synthase (glutamine-hydrolyzing) [Puia sp.]
MCGIAGIVKFNGLASGEAAIRGMTDAIAHRGPDADGFWMEDGVAFGHRRLSIIDLSTAANQPFTDHSGRYVMVFNGEMYNYQEVKALITDYPFHTTSDTEVLIAAYIKWGADCLKYFRGMFAFAIWDRQEKEIFIARDRMGVKPLYYFTDGEILLFASEVRSILTTGLVKKKVNQAALADYFSYQSVTYPHSLVEGIVQLDAGTWMRIGKGRSVEKRYWDVTDNPVDFDFSNEAATRKRIRELMLTSVERRLVSDVPVGAFLSGGIDSSVVVGLMAEASSDHPNTFNISFEEKEFDESRYAEIIAKKFDTHHTRILLKPTDFLDELQNGLNAMDQPSGDGINTYCVSKVIRRSGMTVALSGVGGDELFAGYPFFDQYLQIQKKSWIWNIPAAFRKLLANSMSPGQDQGKKGRMMQMLKMDSCAIDNVYPVFRQILSPSLLQELTGIVHPPFTTSLQKELKARKGQLDRLPLLSQVSAAEYLGYTQHTLLKDTDQMSMAVGLEVREPFFDQDLVEFVLAVPDRLKKPVYPKSLLVESVKPLLPDEVVFRKKQGFLFPWDIWLKNELRSFCDLRLKSMAGRSFIKGDALLAYWQRFLAGDRNIRWSEIWLFVVLEYWLEKNQVAC